MINSCVSDVCSWSESGDSFIIKDQERFTALLPHFFKHKNFRSFVRQLNFYGFRKIRMENSLLAQRPQHWAEFKHESFKKEQPGLLKLIKRTGTTDQNNRDGQEANENELLREQVNSMQEQLDTLTNLVAQIVQEHNIDFHQQPMKRRRLDGGIGALGAQFAQYPGMGGPGHPLDQQMAGGHMQRGVEGYDPNILHALTQQASRQPFLNAGVSAGLNAGRGGNMLDAPQVS
mmetsp:Transcript_63052/g.173020  ORF Transcript_63052/g.173020 Transcript_63052/m.173020 type:complete len:231 (+) Transcript_63052:562-1254(+)